MSIADNIAAIRERMAAAARRAGRNPEDVALMAVSKTFSPDAIREAYAAGQRLFGESRVQEFAAKAESLRDLRDAEWHMIGHLQANKTGKAAELFSAIDSVDSPRVGRRLNDAARELGRKLMVLLEINVGGEQAKSGMDPESQELGEVLAAAPELENLELAGLMTVPPFAEDPEESRAHFRRMRELLARIGSARPELRTLSMGMSHDFEVAIEEGSTCVRIGTAIFGDRA